MKTMTAVLPNNPLEGRDPDRNAWTKTFTGKTFYYCYVAADVFDIIDIGHSLSRLCRWIGHVDCEHYSVAEHSIIMSDYALGNLDEDRYAVALAALIHDAAETYTADIPRPYKMLFPELKTYERFLTKAIFEAFGLPWEYYAVVKEYDTRIMANESHLVKGAANEFQHLIPLEKGGSSEPRGLLLMRPNEAERMYLQTYQALVTSWKNQEDTRQQTELSTES